MRMQSIDSFCARARFPFLRGLVRVRVLVFRTSSPWNQPRPGSERACPTAIDLSNLVYLLALVAIRQSRLSLLNGRSTSADDALLSTRQLALAGGRRDKGSFGGQRRVSKPPGRPPASLGRCRRDVLFFVGEMETRSRAGSQGEPVCMGTWNGLAL